MIATIALTLALVGQLAAPVEPLGPAVPGWTTPKDGRSQAGWYMVRKDAAGNYHVFARDQPGGKFQPYSTVRPPINFGVDMNHRHPLHPSAGEVRGTDAELGRELARSLLPISAAPHCEIHATAPCPGPGPCPSPRRPEPKPLPKPEPAVPGLNVAALVGAGVLVLLAGLFLLALFVLILFVRKPDTPVDL